MPFKNANKLILTLLVFTAPMLQNAVAGEHGSSVFTNGKPIITARADDEMDNKFARRRNASAARQIEPIDYLIKFDITGNFSGVTPQGAPVFTIAGPGYSTITTSSGEVLDSKIPGLQRASLSNAQITFVQPQAGDPAYVSRFTCLTDNGGCRIELPDGSVLVADPEIGLDGRLVGGTDQLGNPSPWGFIPNDAFDPLNGVFPQRILGCGGLRGIEGPLAGTVGAICFNGTFNVPVGPNGIDVNRPLTGGSNCTISLHHPAFPGQ